MVVDGLKNNLKTGTPDKKQNDDDNALLISMSNVEIAHSEPIDDSCGGGVVEEDDDVQLLGDASSVIAPTSAATTASAATSELRPLSELTVDIDAIRPGSQSPRTILDEPNGLRIMLHFARDRPRPDVAVIVITTLNHSREPISDFMFDASISKVFSMAQLLFYWSKKKKTFFIFYFLAM